MKYLFTYHALLKILWWARLELNQRHKDFQSFALPTELLALWYSHQDLNLKPSPCKGAAPPLRHASMVRPPEIRTREPRRSNFTDCLL